MCKGTLATAISNPPKIRANWLAVILVRDGSAECLTLCVSSEHTQLLHPKNAKCCINSQFSLLNYEALNSELKWESMDKITLCLQRSIYLNTLPLKINFFKDNQSYFCNCHNKLPVKGPFLISFIDSCFQFLLS